MTTASPAQAWHERVPPRVRLCADPPLHIGLPAWVELLHRPAYGLPGVLDDFLRNPAQDPRTVRNAGRHIWSCGSKARDIEHALLARGLAR
jgi:hypothetical protein